MEKQKLNEMTGRSMNIPHKKSYFQNVKRALHQKKNPNKQIEELITSYYTYLVPFNLHY